MHKYIIDSGWLVMPSGNAIEAQGREVCLHAEAYAALAAKDRDLADANHALLLANNSADAFRRVAEQRQGEIERYKRAVEWCLENGAKRGPKLVIGKPQILGPSLCPLQVPAELSGIIKPAKGENNG